MTLPPVPQGHLVRIDRTARTVTFTGVCVLLPAGGHTLVTGVSPSWSVQTLATVLASALIAPLSGRRKPLAFGAVPLSVPQIALHIFLPSLCRPPKCRTPPWPVSRTW
ncbi:hypothetical protein ACFYW8_25840 [Streptomyces sp. NPDC002742]|uniref:hypothetical protein n=1 Tax=Streptomyces sp. NPDC002742 TaxID=3364663 RepID=UPI00369B6923